MADDTVTTFSLVTIPERMAVSESIRASAALSEHEILVDRVIVNRCTPNLDHPFLTSRRDIEQGYLDELRDRFDDIGIHQIPLESSDIHGIDHLRRVGSHMLGPIEPFESTDVELSVGNPMKYHIIRSEVRFENENDTEYQLHLPGANKDEMTLRGEDGVLFIGLNNKEKKLNIGRQFDSNSVGAQLNDDILTVRIPK
jgi:arsenite-transporting ATPase